MTYKHKLLGVVALSLLPLALSAQSASEAFRLGSATDPTGSARYTALSGAMGAVGSDASSLVRNPAGISLYRGDNRLSLTLGVAQNNTRNSWYGNSTRMEGKWRVPFEEFSYQRGTSRDTRGRLSFVFSIRNGGSFDRSFRAQATPGAGMVHSSLADYAAARTNNARYDYQAQHDADFTLSKLQSTSAFDNPRVPFISILGAGSGWISPDKDPRDPSKELQRYGSTYGSSNAPSYLAHPERLDLEIYERGNILNYDLALGIEATDALHFGIVGTLSSLDYDLTSYYTEGFNNSGRLFLRNQVSVSGFGAGLGLGALYEVAEGLRLGASLYTPTFYSMKSDFISYGEGIYGGKKGNVRTPSSAASSYVLRGPWRFGLSGAYVLGRSGILSVDYEYTTLGNLRITNPPEDRSYDSPADAGYEEDNAQLKGWYRGIHTLRAGAEVMLDPRFALRAGYRFTSSPIKDGMVKDGIAQQEAFVSGPVVHYSLPGAINSFSAGLGYRLSPSVSLDVAYVYTHQDVKTFAFPYVNDYGNHFGLTPQQIKDQNVRPVNIDGAESINETRMRHKIAATVSFRF